MTSHDPAEAADVTVRPARPDDSAGIAAVTLASWQGPYAELLPVGALDGVGIDEIVEEWRATLTDLPSRRHVVLVALEGAAVVGHAVLEPASDPDMSGADDRSELVDLVVHPDRQRRGHGSRLLAAAVDIARGSGVAGLTTWVVAVDEPRTTFLRTAGFAEDGAERTLDTGPGTAAVAQRRFTTSL
jgi:GNAT superfamily N-acetyltransferase